MLSPFRPIVRLLGRSNFIRATALFAGFVVAGAYGLYHFEHDANPAYRTAPQAVWGTVVLVTSGMDYAQPETTGGMVTSALVCLGGVGLLGLFTATVTTFLVDLHQRRRRGRLPVKNQGHIVVCGWNQKGPEIVAQLTSEMTGKRYHVVIVGTLDESPLDHPQVQFVHGDPTSEEVLARANVAEAARAMVLPAQGQEDADGRSLLVTLALRSVSPDLYICVEALQARHIVHLRRAGANEIISSTEVAANMLAQAALTPGVTRLYDEILSNRYGHEVYRIPVGSQLAGKAVGEAADVVAQSEPILILAVDLGDGDVRVNPPRDLVIEADATLLVLAERYPGYLVD